jgi:phage terminase large subunit
MAALEVKMTNVFKWNWEALNDKEYKYILNQGGTRSSKTYSLCQVLIVYCLTNPKTAVSMVRISLPLLKRSIMRDVIGILKDMNLYDVNNHNKTEQVYTFGNGSSIEFLSADSSDKLKGPGRDILVLNEATELPHSSYMQLAMRTRGKIIIDFNPEDMEHWVYDLIKDPKSILIKSTYKDNPFLPQEQVDFIEDMINVDENYYKTYVLGERPTSTTRIYTHFKQYTDQPEVEDYCYGLDFGFNHPCALVKTSFSGNKVYIEELIYKSKLTTADLIKEMNILGIDKQRKIYCDSARPEVIEELKRAGYTRADLSDKSVKAGIDKVKSMEVFIHYEATNLLKEFKLYSWKTSNDAILDEPVKLNDDGMDALRYAIHTHHKSGGFNKFYTQVFTF